MAKPKLRMLYHQFFCGEGNLGEMDAFFALEGTELKYIDGWDCNDASWRAEYMEGLLKWAGVKVETLPEKYHDEAAQLAAKAFGLDYGDDESEEDDGEGSTKDGGFESVSLFYREGTSDKVYSLELIENDGFDEWCVIGHYGRRGGKIKDDVKCNGVPYKKAKATFDKVLGEKIKKGYQYA